MYRTALFLSLAVCTAAQATPQLPRHAERLGFSSRSPFEEGSAGNFQAQLLGSLYCAGFILSRAPRANWPMPAWPTAPQH